MRIPPLDMRIPPPVAACLGATALALLVFLGLGGAATRPAGLWLGAPGLPGAALSLALPALLLASRQGRLGLSRGAGFAVPALLLLAGLPLTGLRTVSGPVLLALAGAVVTAACAALWRRAPRLLLLPAVFVVFVCSGARSNVRVGPQGDEPHYLMVADSLLRDHDLSLESDYAQQRYSAFHDAPLAPHFRVRGRGHEIYSLHAVGLSVAILPAWAIGGYPAVTVFMALLAALLVCEARAWITELSGREDVAEGTAWLLALSPPLLHYAGLVFTEVPAALALAFGLRRGRASQSGLAGTLAVGLAAAVLPWLNVRYAPLAILVVAHAVWRRRRARDVALIVAPLLVSAVGIGLYHEALYGFWDPRRVYGRHPELSLGTLVEGLPGLFLDQEFGLLVYAPVLALALPGIALMLRRDRKLGVVVSLAVATVVLTAGAWPMWRGGFNPPGRFLVPVVPLLFACAALVWSRCGLTAGAALLAGWGLWTGIGGALEPQLVHRDRDGTAPFFRTFSGAHEWTGLLPRYVLEEPDRRRLAAVWAVALLAAVPWRPRRLTAARAAVAALGLVAAAEAASLSGRSDAAERDAVRVVGRPAIAVPGWFVTRSVTAEWTSAALDWGPLYDAHRFPEGAAVGRRLPLLPGRYRVVLLGELLAGPSDRPRLEWAADRPGAVWSEIPLAPAAGGLAGTFVATAGGADLRLRGGGPLLLRRVELSAQPSRDGPV